MRMRKKVIKKFFIIVLIELITISAIHLISNAETSSFDDIDVGFVLDDASDSTTASKTTVNIIGSIVTIVQVIASGVAVIMIIVIAMKYMISSPGERADIKKSATAYIVGAVILFAATGILGIIKVFTGNIKAEE